MSETSGSSGEQNKKPPTIIEMSDTQLSCVPETQAFHEILTELGRYELGSSDDFLFCGADGAELLSSGTHGDRHTTYALSTAEYATQATREDTYGADYSGTPYKIAHRHGGKQPILAIYNARLLSGGVDNEDVQYETIPGVTLDDALLAIIKLT